MCARVTGLPAEAPAGPTADDLPRRVLIVTAAVPDPPRLTAFAPGVSYGATASVWQNFTRPNVVLIRAGQPWKVVEDTVVVVVVVIVVVDIVVCGVDQTIEERKLVCCGV